MRIYDLIKLCVANLWKRKVRTVLTVLGVVIGTSSIVVMISLGVGLEQAQTKMIGEYMDLTTIQVYGSYGNADQVKLNQASLEAINALKNVVAASPVLRMYASDPEWSEAVMSSGRYRYNGIIIGLDVSMMESLGYQLTEGRWPDSGDEFAVMFGENALYSFIDPEQGSSGGFWIGGGMTVVDGEVEKEKPKVDPKINRIFIQPGFHTKDDEGNDRPQPSEIKNYRITAPGTIKGDYTKDYGESFNAAYVDYRFIMKLRQDYYKLNDIRIKDNGYDNVLVKVNDIDNVVAVEALIKDMGFDTYSAAQQREQMAAQMRNIQMVLGALGAVSMLVAALGIANTMVMSIYERTREIGVMKVIGCRLRDIRSMFLVEAAFIGMLGGISGLALSYGLSAAMNKAMASSGMFGGGGDISVIPAWLVVLGFTFSVGVGLLSGVYPAARAVKISALAAIRQD